MGQQGYFPRKLLCKFFTPKLGPFQGLMSPIPDHLTNYRRSFGTSFPDQITYTNLQKLYIHTGVGRVEISGGITHKHTIESLNSTLKDRQPHWMTQ